MRRERRFALGALLNLGAFGVNVVVQLPLSIVIIRHLDKPAYGLLAHAIAVTSIGSVLLGGGLAIAIQREAASAPVELVNRIALAGLRVATVQSAAGVAVTLAATTIMWPGSRVLTLLALAPIFVLAPVRELLQGLAYGTYRPGVSLMASLGTSLSMLLLTAALVSAREDEPWLFAAARGSAGAFGVLVLAIGMRKSFSLTLGGAMEGASWRIFRLSNAMLMTTVVGTVISQLDVVILGVTDHVTAVGAYAPVARTFDIIVGLVATGGAYLISEMAGATTEEAVRMLRWASRLALTMLAPAITMLLAAPQALFELMYGGTRPETTMPGRMLGLALFVSLSLGFNSHAVAAVMPPRTLVRNELVTLVFAIVVVSIAVPLLGIVGAALATSSTVVFANVIASATLGRIEINVWATEHAKSVVRAIAVAAAAVFIIETLELQGLVSLIVAGGFGMVPPVGILVAGTWSRRAVFRP